MTGVKFLLSAQESLIEQVGAPGSPLKRPKGKEARVKLATLLDSALPPELRLRAHLALGKPPPLDLLIEDNIRRSLTAKDCLSRVPSLAVKIPVLEATAPLRAAARLAQNANEKSLRAAISKLAKMAEKWDAKRDKVHLGDQTIVEFIRLTDVLCQKFSQVSHRSFNKWRELKWRELLLRLVEVGARWAAASNKPEQLEDALRLLGSVEKFASLSIQEEMEEAEQFAVVVRDLRQKSIDYMISSATSSDASTLERLVRALLGMSFSREFATAKLDELYEQRFAFDEELQATLASLSGHQSAPVGVQGLDSDLEQTEALQLASILLSAWKARHEGPRSSETFEEMKSVLGNFFDLRLIDQADELQAYNPRIHEFVQGERHTATVRVVRPLVEQSRDRSRIIVKALVRATPD